MHSVLGAKIIPGRESFPNAGTAPIDDLRNWPYQSAEYGCQDLLAYGSYSDDSGDVFVVDMNSMQLVQTLHGHNAPVTCVHWKPAPASYLQHGLFLITGDRLGAVAIWDVAEGVIVNSVQVPNAQPIYALNYLAKQHLLAVTRDGSNFVYDSHLAGTEPIREFQFPIRTGRTDSFAPLRLCTSKLSSTQASCVVLGDRLRVIGSLETGVRQSSSIPYTKDLIYDSADGHETVLDAAFSEANEELLFFATRNSVGAYDWKTNLLLNEQVLWHAKSDVEFRRLFASSPASLAEMAQGLPFLYSFGTDQRLCAWHMCPREKVTSVAADVRGVRIVSKKVSNVVQSQLTANLFAVIFADGSVARWRYLVERRRWSLEGFFAFALFKPTRLCVAGDNVVCCALENGHIVLIDVMHNVTLRRINIVHAGGTRIILLSPHRWGESVWVVTNKATQLRHFHQVTLFDCRSGVPLRVLRRPTHPDATRMSDITLSATGTFLLLTFLDGNFEVWGVEAAELIYAFEGMGVAGVSWAPQVFLSCLTGVHGTPQLLAIIFTDGGMSLWTVYKDRVVKNRDVTSLFSAGSIARVRCVPTDEALIVMDGVKLPLVMRLGSSGFTLRALKSVSVNTPVLHVAVPKGAGLSTDSRAEASASSQLVAVAFVDGSFGVWGASNQERVSYSRATRINLAARHLTWVADKLLVLTSNGDLALIDKSLTSVNSSVSCKVHRRPVQTSAFFLPAHRTHIQTLLETQVMCDSPGTSSLQSTSTPSYLVQGIDPRRRPCRGPFGQVITEAITTLAQELDIYKETMVPRHIRDPLQRACVKKSTEELAFWVARFFGQVEKQRFWLQFCITKGLWRPGCGAGDEPQPLDQIDMEQKLSPPFFYNHCNRFSEAVANPDVVRSNRLCFNEHRIAALEAAKNQTVDSSACRLAVARELLKLQEPQQAITVLMDVNFLSDQFPHLSNLAVTIAAASVPCSDAASFPLFVATARHAAAMSLERGDADAAVEKYMLCGDYYEAALSLQSCGNWSEAAVLAKLTSMAPPQKQELLRRWCSYYAKRGEMMEVARMLFSMASPSEALVLLSESAHLTDVAGLLAIVLLADPLFSSREFLQKVIPSPLRDEDPSEAPSLGDIVLNTLADYCGVLNSVGNVVAERTVLELIASLKRGHRNASTPCL
ncbi:uncharacterized protein Tco025E_00551 [Trypanosoma conorhini]|uniref:Uncharacterized protein n=1 Tax=Trypanosoma conorhini TaxID=83891 RepID=A0A422QB74_9TRYP|nr:uncharacterized protein Tco025E_00551 [Trypanosoma conorhini]RNF27243.1 hypothetical protein Tco025E_00551 [Trypanosoma conorhini]